MNVKLTRSSGGDHMCLMTA